MAGLLMTKPQNLTVASGSQLYELGALYYDSTNAAWYRYVQADATLVVGELQYLKTPSSWTVAVCVAGTAATLRKALGWACSAMSTTLPYGWLFVGGLLDVNVIASILTDTNVADGDYLVPDTVTNGAVKPGTLGTDDGRFLGVAHGADSGTALTSMIARGLSM